MERRRDPSAIALRSDEHLTNVRFVIVVVDVAVRLEVVLGAFGPHSPTSTGKAGLELRKTGKVGAVG